MGTGCNKLHVASIAAFYTYVTLPQSVNSSGYTGYRYVLIPHTAGLVGIKTITQGAFSDTRDNSFRLTQAMEVTIPAVMPREAARRLATYHFLPTSTAGLINPNGSYLYNPILRWTR